MPGVDGCLGRGVVVVCSGCGALAVRLWSIGGADGGGVGTSVICSSGVLVAGCMVSRSVARLVVDTGRSGGGSSN